MPVIVAILSGAAGAVIGWLLRDVPSPASPAQDSTGAAGDGSSILPDASASAPSILQGAGQAIMTAVDSATAKAAIVPPGESPTVLGAALGVDDTVESAPALSTGRYGTPESDPEEAPWWASPGAPATTAYSSAAGGETPMPPYVE